MKAKDLKRLLERADAEMEVFASPLILMRSMTLGVDDGTLADETFIETADPTQKFPIAGVGEYTSTYGEDDGSKYLILSYAQNKLPENESSDEDFVN